jgi:rsbT co-antagonist protein RsbR
MIEEVFDEDSAVKNDQQIMQQVRGILTQLVNYVGEYLQTEDTSILDQAEKWGETIGYLSVNNGSSLERTLKNMTSYKEQFWRFLDSHSIEPQMTMTVFTDLVVIIDTIFNQIITGFSHAFTVASERKIQETKDYYLSFSVPIVPIKNGIAVLPLVGEIDEKRAKLLIEQSLTRSSQLKLSKLIIDFSGVYKVDEIVVESLEKLILSLGLIGVKPILTGLRAEMSLSFINSGAAMKNIEIKSTVEQVLN